MGGIVRETSRQAAGFSVTRCPCLCPYTNDAVGLNLQQPGALKGRPLQHDEGGQLTHDFSSLICGKWGLKASDLVGETEARKNYGDDPAQR